MPRFVFVLYYDLCSWHLAWSVDLTNTGAKFILGNLKLYLDFLSFLHIEMVEVDEILPRTIVLEIGFENQDQSSVTSVYHFDRLIGSECEQYHTSHHLNISDLKFAA